MALTKKCAETLLDLVEVKLSCIEVFDREDAREVALLETCRAELMALTGGRETARVIPMEARRTGIRAAAN